MKKRRYALRYNKALRVGLKCRENKSIRTDNARSPDETEELRRKKQWLHHDTDRKISPDKTPDVLNEIDDTLPNEEKPVKAKRLREKQYSAHDQEKHWHEAIHEPDDTEASFSESDPLDEPDNPDDVISADETTARRKRQRAQAQTFRKAEEKPKKSLTALKPWLRTRVRADTLNTEHRKSRLIHEDKGNRMVQGAGRAMQRGLRAAALPAKAYLHHEMSEADSDNAAIQSAEAGRKSVSLLEASLRQDNLRKSGHAHRLNDATRHERAAQTEKRKKDQIRAFQ